MITLHARFAKTLSDKTKGLLGAKTAYPLFFKTHFGIHTFGMRYPIDVVIVDKNYRIRALKQALSPNSIFIWNPFFNGVLELPSGTIKRCGLRTGDTIHLVLE